MPLERHLFRDMFAPNEVVELRRPCFTPSQFYEPGKYFAGQLPDLAFEMGLVDKLPPIRGKNAEIRAAEIPPDSEPTIETTHG